MIAVVLVEPAISGNVGAVARVMANFNFKELILVNPKCDHRDLDAVSRARKASSILKRAKVVKWDDLKFDHMIALTAAIDDTSNVARVPLLPDELAEQYPILSRSKTALVFGRENDGLRNSEIERCDIVVTIPTSTKYRALNLSHAVSIMLYELSKKSRMRKITKKQTMASRREKQVLSDLLGEVMVKFPFNFRSQRATQLKIWQRVIGKSMMTKREAFALIGFFRKVKRSQK